MNNSNEPMKVVVVLVDLQMPFLSIVTLMVKWALAVFSLVHTPVLGLRVGAPVLLQMTPDV